MRLRFKIIFFSATDVNFLNFTIPGARVEHWCLVDELDDLPYADQQRIAIPYNKEEEEYSQCTYYVDNYTKYTDEELCWTEDFNNKSWRGTAECTAWEYNRTEFIDSPVSEVRIR